MIVFDFECFRYDWLFVALDLETEQYTIIENDRQRMIEFYEQHKQDIWIGYNCKNYDKYILQAIIEGINPKPVNDYIIGGGVGWKLFDKKLDINLYDCMIMGKSLKQLESYFGVDIRETEIDFNIDRPLTDKERASNIEYCKSDVYNTALVFMHNKQEFEAQLGLIKLSGGSLQDLAKTKAQLSAKILEAKPLPIEMLREEWQFEYNQCVKDYDYKHKDVLKFFDSLRETKDAKAKYECELYGVPHVFALGGVHAGINNYFYDNKCVSKENKRLLHVDVASYYPHIMTEWGFLTRAVPSIQKFKDIMELRLKYKKEKNPLQAPLKIAINGSYGQSGAGKQLEDGSYKILSNMFDPRRMREVCINGQLMLLQLIEDVMENVDSAVIVNTNTDGIVFEIDNNDFNKLDGYVKAWEKRTKMTMEYDDTSYLAQKDVNNFITIFTNDEMERKGSYVKTPKPCDYDLPILSDCIVEYFVHGITPEEYINNINKLAPFMKTYKLMGSYVRALHGDEEQQGKVFRVFASCSRKDGCLYKQKEGKNKEKFAGCPERCKIVNSDIRGLAVPSWLDKNWYIEQAWKRIKDYVGGDKNDRQEVWKINSVEKIRKSETE